MQNRVEDKLVEYEKNYLEFQRNLHKFKNNNLNKFVAFKEGTIISSGFSVAEVREDLISKGIEPSELVIEFVPEKEINMII